MEQALYVFSGHSLFESRASYQLSGHEFFGLTIILSKGMPVNHLETDHDLTYASLLFIFPYNPTLTRGKLRRSCASVR
jgi:hypothetical protein